MGQLGQRSAFLLSLCACAGDAGDSAGDAPACATTVIRAEVAVTNVDKVDVLFVVDDSPSMAEEQEALRRELPKLVEKLLTGVGPDGTEEFEPVKDLHVGVVSADLGAGGVENAPPGCTARGDDGLLQHTAVADGCGDDYPPFLSFVVRHPLAQPPSTQTPQTVAADFACIAPSGVSGCGYAQPLEAALEALDRAGEGFLRSEPLDGLSLIGIVIVTDKDDCSVADPAFFAEPADGRSIQARCATAGDGLHLHERYEQGLRALRTGNEHLVMLSVIAGVPPDLLAAQRDSSSDAYYGFLDGAARDAFYARLLADPRMQVAELGDGTLAPACESTAARATPARRLADLVSRFGTHHSYLHSICEEDWSPALAPMTRTIARRTVGAVCLPRVISRDTEGLTDCEVHWELSPPGRVHAGSIASCDEVPSLLELHRERPMTDAGGQRCVVRQLAVTGAPENPVIEPGHGWYYDDFSEDVRRECTSGRRQSIAFSPDAAPPSGVLVTIECVQTRLLEPAEDGGLTECRVPG